MENWRLFNFGFYDILYLETFNFIIFFGLNINFGFDKKIRGKNLKMRQNYKK